MIATKEHPVIFSTESVKAILDGIKTQIRRVIKNQSHWWKYVGACATGGWRAADAPLDRVPVIESESGFTCPYGQVGDRLWLKHRYDLFDTYYAPISAPTGGWNTTYAAGTDGHIYRMDKGEPRILKEAPTGDKGYLAVTLSDGSYRSTQLVHRLVVKAFYGLPPAYLYRTQTRHLDGNNQNNLPSNLDWGTQEDNWLDRKYHGRGMGEAHPSAKLTHSQARDISISTKSQRQLANIYNVSQPTIQAVKSGKLWQTTPPQPHRNYPAWKSWQSPLFMPRWASRITLEITEVRVERLQEITPNDIEAEGVDVTYSGTEQWVVSMPYSDMAKLWNSLNAKRGFGWEVNPWVFVIQFKVLEGGNAYQK